MERVGLFFLRGLRKLAATTRNPLVVPAIPSAFLRMIETLRWLAISIPASLRKRRDWALENLALGCLSLPTRLLLMRPTTTIHTFGGTASPVLHWG